MHRIYADRINSRGMSPGFCDLCSQKTPRGILPVNSNENAPHKMWYAPRQEDNKNNKFLYRQPCYGWRYFMLLLYIAHDISLVSLHAVSFEVVGCCSNLCN